MANSKTKAQLEAEIEELKKALSARDSAPVAPVTPVAPATTTTDVTVVYMSDSLGFIKVGDLELNASRFGEQFIISRNQFDALVGKYRSWFDRGILAVAPQDIHVASMKGLRTSDEYAISYEKLNKLGTMSPTEIEKFWNSVPTDAHRTSIVTFFKRKNIEGVEPGYKDRARIDVLDRLTDGGFSQERDEVNGHVKLTPINL